MTVPRISTPLVELADRPQSSGGLDLSGLLRMVLVRQRLILGTVLVVVALALVGVYNTVPQYDARALVLIDQRQNKVVDVNAVLSGLENDPTSVENQLEILRSRSLMQHVIAKLGLENKAAQTPPKPPGLLSQVLHNANLLTWFQDPPLPKTPTQLKNDRREGLVNELIGSESVTSIGRSSALQITYRSSDPKEAADMANAIADAYVEDQINTKFEATQKTSQWLADRLQELSTQMQSVDAAVQEYKAANNINETPGGGSVLDQQLAQLNAQLVTARSDLAEAQAKYAQARQLQASGKAEDLSQVFQSGMIAQLRTQQAELLRQKAQYMSTFGPLHPKMVDLESQLKDVNTKINEEVNRVVATVASDVAVANAHVQSLEASLAKSESQTSEQSKAEVKLTELQARSTSAHQLYEAFLAKFKETQGQENIQTPDSRVITRATVPHTPSVPNKTRSIEIAVAGGLLLGLMLAMGAERLDGGVQTVQQLENLISLPVLATIPELKGRTKQIADRVVEKPLSSFAEAVRGLQMAILHSNVDRKPKVILVTSSVPDEGKTTVALSLARISARVNKKVLLIDCDLRRPCVADLLGIQLKTNGLLNVLSGEKTLEESLIPDPRSPVQCLLGLRVPSNPADVLGSAAMERLINTIKQDWDFVILDSAPLLPVNDTKILTDLVDTVTFVVRWEKTRRQAIADSVKMLTDLSAPVAGAVMTRTDIRRYRYYSYGRDYYAYNKYYND